MNPFMAQRNTNVFSADTDSFRPERWLEAETLQLYRMNAKMLLFGAGTSICMGQPACHPNDPS
jgi:cytochrome P450